MATSRSTLHVAMFPWFATGHITPYLLLSNQLAERGYKVSFLASTKQQNKFNHLNLHPHLIHFITLSVGPIDGVPPGAETMSEVNLDQLPPIQRAFDQTKDQVEIALINLKPDVVFFDFAYWLPSLMRPLGIKSIYLGASSALTHYGIVPAKMNIMFKKGLSEMQCTNNEEPAPELYPGSSSATQRPFQQKDLMYSLTAFDGTISLFERVYTAMKESDAFCFRACTEMEGPFVDYLEGQYKKPAFLIGPLLTKQSQDIPLEERWGKWLDGFEKESVVYCAFGSECVLEKEQFQELVLGLEQTGLPFIVRLKPPVGSETVEEALPEGFEERVRGKGVVHGGWVQQQLILSHPSVGCFVSHCGFGSMWESLLSTCQIVLVPHFADQFAHADFMTKRLKVAVDVERRDEDGWFTREGVCNAVKLVMDKGSEVSQQVRANHHKLREILSDNSFEPSYINNFVIKLQDFVK